MYAVLLLASLFSQQATCVSAQGEKTRRIFNSFFVDISPTIEELPGNSINSLHSHIREVMVDMFVDRAEELGGLGFRYVAISNIEAAFNPTEETSTLTIGEGVVSFIDNASNTPSEAQVNAWAQEAVLKGLLAKLQQDSDLSFITFVGEPQESETNKEELEEPDTTNVGPPTISADSSSSNNNTLYIITGALVAFFTMTMLATFFILRSRSKVCVYPYGDEDPDDDMRDDEKSQEGHGSDSDQTENSPGSEEHKEISPTLTATLALQTTLSENDARSVAASESSWTVNTEAGDSTALKSIPHNSSVDLWQGLPMVSPESFEYDRPVNLRKDMLTSAWSGRMPTNPGVKSDSVLQPSHFSASQERRRRRMEDGAQQQQQKEQLQTVLEIYNSSPQKGRDEEPAHSAFGFVPADASEDIVMVPPRPKARSFPNNTNEMV